MEIKALVGIAKCPHSKQLYGVRVEIDGKKWIATWAFAIRPEVAKREGYEENEFPPDLLYDKKYPGCPYCKKKEDLVAISAKPKPAPKKKLAFNVTTAGYDNIGQILTSLNVRYDSFTAKGFQCDVLFLNCGTPDYVDANALRKFVSDGGCLYASDLTDSILTRAFPGVLKIRDHDGAVCKLKANVNDPELREIIGGSIDIEFDLPCWAVLQSSTGETLLSASRLSRYSNLPIMVKFRYGKGIVFYTCFHNYAQASDKEKALLQLLILRQLGANDNVSIESAGRSLGVDVDAIKAKFKSNF